MFEYKVTGPDDREVNDANGSSSGAKRPVSMFETREGLNASKAPPTVDNNRTTTSMYQIDGQHSHINGNVNGSASSASLPRSDDVKYRTEVVTRRIQELWSAMQEMSTESAFVPCAERVRVAVAELVAIFPVVSSSAFLSKKYFNSFLLIFF